MMGRYRRDKGPPPPKRRAWVTEIDWTKGGKDDERKVRCVKWWVNDGELIINWESTSAKDIFIDIPLMQIFKEMGNK